MREPTDEELKIYAEKLPRIYKQVLEAFTKSNEDRRHGEALDFESIQQWVMLVDGLYRSTDVFQAAENLVDRGVLSKESFKDAGLLPATWFKPTDLGERLVATLTGRVAPKDVVPALPEFAWN